MTTSKARLAEFRNASLLSHVLLIEERYLSLYFAQISCQSKKYNKRLKSLTLILRQEYSPL